MKKELVTEDELMSQLRLQGIADIKDVKTASLEGDGKISIITKNRKLPSPRQEAIE